MAAATVEGCPPPRPRPRPHRDRGATLDVLRPRDPEALLDEAFAHEEYLPYWAELWPSAPVLAQRLAERDDLHGLRILELGCGLALPSLFAASRGAGVVATDWAPDALELLHANAARNGVTLQARRLDWFADAPSRTARGRSSSRRTSCTRRATRRRSCRRSSGRWRRAARRGWPIRAAARPRLLGAGAGLGDRRTRAPPGERSVVHVLQPAG